MIIDDHITLRLRIVVVGNLIHRYGNVVYYIIDDDRFIKTFNTWLDAKQFMGDDCEEERIDGRPILHWSTNYNS